MARRHTLEAHNWQSIFRRLEELVLANSGEDEFSEVFKILIAKIYAETFHPETSLLRETSTATYANVVATLARANLRWPGILVDDVQPRLEPDHLQVCLEAIDPLSLRETSLEVMDGLFEYLISRSSKGAKGQYFTPRHVIEACVQIVAPSLADKIADPACGSSGFLLHGMQHATRDCRPEQVRRYAAENVWGFDIDQRAVQVAKAMMLVAGDMSSNIFRLNSLITAKDGDDLFADTDGAVDLTVEDVTRTQFRNFNGFDAILTNPPFAGEVREDALLSSYGLARKGKRNERDVLFLERSVKLLRPGGRLAIVLPQNKVGALSYAYAREWLIRQAHIVAVLSLGRNTFQPHTGQKADIIFAVRREHPLRSAADAHEEILFMVSEKDGKDSKGVVQNKALSSPTEPLWLRADHDLAEAVEQFHRFVAERGIPWRSV